jgi:hypothetical protein
MIIDLSNCNLHEAFKGMNKLEIAPMELCDTASGSKIDFIQGKRELLWRAHKKEPS